MKSNILSKLFGVALCTLVLSAIFPVAAQGQRRWVRSRRVVIYNYQPRPYVIYQRGPYQSYGLYAYTPGYRQRYYESRYYNYGYSQPYYTNRYYSYRYSQPCFANRHTYSWANPTYVYRTRPRHRGVRWDN